MDTRQERFLDILERSVPPQAGDAAHDIALSGGLDSSAIAYVMRERRPSGHAVIADGFVASDLAYCQTVSSRLGIPLEIIRADTAEIVSAVEETVRILGNFNDIEVRNAVVMYLAISAVRGQGKRSIITGDGADELFAGYDFMLKKTPEEIGADLRRISEIMHFPSRAIGEALGVNVETPFLSPEMIEFARGLPAGCMVGTHNGKKYGKMVIRNAMSGRMPDQITWRKKAAMQDGAGTAGLTGMFEGAVPDGVFARMQRDILEQDGVRVRTKESLHYYQVYRRIFGAPTRGGGADCGTSCPDCGGAVMSGSRFCRMCGRFPV